MISVECVLRGEARLGESPVWSEAEQALYFVDIKKPSINRFDPSSGQVTSWAMPQDIGSMGLREKGGAVVALRHGFGIFDFGKAALVMIHDPLHGAPGLRFNDGRCDRAGRFWSGTVSETRTPGTAKVYRFGADLSCTAMVEGITVANSITWSADDRTMFYSCSFARTIFACDFDLGEGTIRNSRVFAQFGEKDGGPDGATVDAEGCLWVANDHAGRVTRYTPAGKVDRVVEMPVPRATSCCFGGARLDTLYVTSASIGISEEQKRAAPLSGSLFALNVGVKGLPEPVFKG